MLWAQAVWEGSIYVSMWPTIFVQRVIDKGSDTLVIPHNGHLTMITAMRRTIDFKHTFAPYIPSEENKGWLC